MNEDDELSPEQRSVVAWRLGKVEQAVAALTAEVKLANEVKQTVVVNTLKITNLEKSRDRIMYGLWSLGLIVAGVILEQLVR